MSGLLALVLHAHLPFVRHPEHERFLEENWLHEAITDCYLPLLRLMAGWTHDRLPWRLTITITPTLGAMLGDPVLRSRFDRYLSEREALAASEVNRTVLEPSLHKVAGFYLERFRTLREFHRELGGDLLAAFARHQSDGHLEILTCAATHALLPLLASHPPSLRGQLQTAREEYRRQFGREPRGIWLPECAYTPEIEPALAEAGLRWFFLETHGVMHSEPAPRRGIFAPLLTPHGLAAFGRDPSSARQVWSRHGGYPGDPRYRDFHADLAHEADWDYVKPYLPDVETRVFSGLKYHRVTGGDGPKEVYDRAAALEAAREHARHFVDERVRQTEAAAPHLDRPPLIVSPYDAELFGHWWYEGPEFLDAVVRALTKPGSPVQLVTPGSYLRALPANQVARPSTSSWGEGGHFAVWLNRANAWMQPHLRTAQDRMSQLAGRWHKPAPLEERALRQAARELLLAQSSDWPFIIHTGTSPDYARARFIEHITAFTELHDALVAGNLDEARLSAIEAKDNLFPDVQPRHWAPS